MYALSTITGLNDAGEFTARATLQANFTTDKITGVIDNFMGADGQPRNWSVELTESTVRDEGDIQGDTGDPAEDWNPTVWTLDGAAAAPAGGWEGKFYVNGDDLVPTAALGRFYSSYGREGQMAGAFGVEKQ